MTGMPYNFETGPTFEVFEDIMNADVDRLLAALNLLRDPAQPLAEIFGLDSRSLDSPNHPTAADRIQQVNNDWLGMRYDRQAGWLPQQPFDPANPKTTGHWTSWYGDAAGIVRTTLQRAAEVSLGLAPRGPGGPPVTRADTTRHWPVILIWKCGQSWFEGWVSWREAGNSGVVVAILATPGNGAVISQSPLAPPNRALPEYAEYPPRPNHSGASCVGKARGHWVIGHVHNRPHGQLGVTTAPTPSGALTLPSLLTVWEGHGSIVTVAPSEPDGGVLANGRPYTP